MNRPKKTRGRSRPHWAGFIDDQTSPLNARELASFAGKRILITGAGGYLGSAVARQLARASAAHLLLLDISEHGLYRLDQHLRRHQDGPGYSLIVGSVTDRALLDDLFHNSAPDIVFHAAARKHVPLMEENLFAAVETNVLGTLALVEAAQSARTPSFVLLSTDKAVSPISVMGATKRIAEQIVLSARAQPDGEAFRCLRLCNVLGSSGSVAPLFTRQILAGRPVTVTEPEATRFFISSADAVRHLLRTAIVSTNTGLLVPRVDQAVRVQDLATFLLARVPHNSPVPVTYTGLRPADKLHEELVSPAETAEERQSLGLFEVASPFDPAVLARQLPALAAGFASRDSTALRDSLELLVPEYRSTKYPDPQLLLEHA